jgi:hypothetical protein
MVLYARVHVIQYLHVSDILQPNHALYPVGPKIYNNSVLVEHMHNGGAATKGPYADYF